MSVPKILIGADPEVFLQKEGRFISAHGLIPGNKSEPFKVDKGAVQVDGMALEFNIDPSATENEFCINIQEVFETLKSMVPEYEVVTSPVAHFSEEYLKTVHPDALVLGCEPDFNAWCGAINAKPCEKVLFRTAAGHVHVGWCNDANQNDVSHIDICQSVVRQMDFFLGLPSVLFDNDTQRRSLYGKAGAYRAKPYGLEYRTLSNVWLKSEDLIRWVYRAANKAVESFLSGNILQDKYGDIQQIINSSDKTEAMKIIKYEGIEVVYA